MTAYYTRGNVIDGWSNSVRRSIVCYFYIVDFHIFIIWFLLSMRFFLLLFKLDVDDLVVGLVSYKYLFIIKMYLNFQIVYCIFVSNGIRPDDSIWMEENNKRRKKERVKKNKYVKNTDTVFAHS